jgi:hypothetical protein
MSAEARERAPAETPGLISIVLTVWGDYVAFLPGTLESLQGQDVPGVELIIVDNASDTPIEGLPAEVQVFRTDERMTVGNARNFGLARASGEYVMFWDADDLLLPGALERMREVIGSDPEIAAVTMDSISWTPETGPGEPWPWPRPLMYKLAPHRRVLAFIALLYNPFTTTGPALIRTRCVRDADGFADIPCCEDWALSGSLAVRGTIVMLREPGRLYRVHDQSLSLEHLGGPETAGWLRGIRARARRDPRVPLWIKALMPLVRLHHFWREHRRVGEDAGIGYYRSALEKTTGTS